MTKRMQKSKSLIVLAASLPLLCGCFFSAKTFEMTANGEILSALTKVTENNDCMCPFGGDNGGTLFLFIVQMMLMPTFAKKTTRCLVL